MKFRQEEKNDQNENLQEPHYEVRKPKGSFPFIGKSRWGSKLSPRSRPPDVNSENNAKVREGSAVAENPDVDAPSAEQPETNNERNVVPRDVVPRKNVYSPIEWFNPWNMLHKGGLISGRVPLEMHSFCYVPEVGGAIDAAKQEENVSVGNGKSVPSPRKRREKNDTLKVDNINSETSR